MSTGSLAPPRTRSRMLLMPLEAADKGFPRTYTAAVLLSASGCRVSWNSCLLITWKGHQKKDRNEKPESLETSSLSCNSAAQELARKG